MNFERQNPSAKLEAPPDGLEPPTRWLTAICSTTELWGIIDVNEGVA